MGVINLKWREATTTAGEFFTQAERNTGWPEKLNYGQLWALQYPCDKGDAVKYKVALERGLDIGAACKRGDLAYTLTPATADVLSNLWTYAVTAPAFAGWLAAQGETPSPYIAAWFEAVDTATPPTLPDNRQQTTTKTIAQATTLTPTVAVGAPGGTGTIWTKERKDAARAMMNEQKGRGIKAFAANTAIAFGVTATRLRKVLNDKPKKAPAKKAKGIWDV